MPRSRPRHRPTFERVGRVLAECRLEAGLTQRELAAALGVSQGTVGQAELGSKNVGLIEFIDWCHACDADPIAVLKKVI